MIDVVYPYLQYLSSSIFYEKRKCFCVLVRDGQLCMLILLKYVEENMISNDIQTALNFLGT